MGPPISFTDLFCFCELPSSLFVYLAVLPPLERAIRIPTPVSTQHKHLVDNGRISAPALVEWLEFNS